MHRRYDGCVHFYNQGAGASCDNEDIDRRWPTATPRPAGSALPEKR